MCLEFRNIMSQKYCLIRDDQIPHWLWKRALLHLYSKCRNICCFSWCPFYFCSPMLFSSFRYRNKVMEEIICCFTEKYIGLCHICLFYSPSVETYCLLISLLTCTFRVTDTFQNLHTPNAVSWTKCIQPAMTLLTFRGENMATSACHYLAINMRYQQDCISFLKAFYHTDLCVFFVYIWIMINACGLGGFIRWFILRKICSFSACLRPLWSEQ